MRTGERPPPRDFEPGARRSERRGRLGTGRARLDPGLDQLAEELLGSGRGLTTGPGVPAPPDQIIVRHVLAELGQGAMAVAVGILDLPADLAERLALPCHLERGELPPRIAWDACLRRAEEGH